MVSGFVTSPDDQSRICFDDARPMRIASNSLISIKLRLSPSFFPGHPSSRSRDTERAGFRPQAGRSARVPLLLHLHVCALRVAERPDLRLGFLAGLLRRRQLDVLEVAELLVGGQGQLAVLVDAPLAH